MPPTDSHAATSMRAVEWFAPGRGGEILSSDDGERTAQASAAPRGERWGGREAAGAADLLVAALSYVEV